MRLTPPQRTDIAILLPNLRIGGAERVGVNLANEFSRRGLGVDMVLGTADGELLQALDDHVRVVDLQAKRARAMLLPLVRYMRKSRPASVVANMWPLTILGVLARSLARSGGRVVAVEHTAVTRAELSRRSLHMLAQKVLSRWFLRKADAIVGVSDGMAADFSAFVGLPRARIATIYNPVAGVGGPTTGSLPANAAPWGKGRKRLLNVGTLKEQKNHRLLLRAFARLDERLGARLMILGDGVLLGELRQLASDLGIAERVTFAGSVPNPTPYYANADLFVLSSEWEGFGNVIVEALEQGTPVVSTDCVAGPREILVDGQHGALVPVADVDAFASAMEDALLREHDREALKRRAQDFSVAKAADSYLDLLLPDWRLGGCA